MRVVNAVLAFLLLIGSSLAQTDVEVALEDRSQFPADQWWRFYYITTAVVKPEARDWVHESLKFVIASMTPRQQVIERSIPIEINPVVHRIDLLELGWDQQAWLDLMKSNPYYVDKNSMMVRGDWLLLVLTDQQEAPNYYALTFGHPAPTTRDEILQRLSVNSDIKYQLGFIEGQSGVNQQGVRFVRSLSMPGTGAYAYGTFDGNSQTSERDPLEVPNGGMKHDGEEWIFGTPKMSSETGQWGVLQQYALANADGALVARAPVDLVVDHTEFRGLPEIRVPGGCISCHQYGINRPTRNELREILKSGTELLARYDDAAFLERFHLTDISREIDRNIEDYTLGVQCISNADPLQVVNWYRLAIAQYDRNLFLEDIARELYIEPEEVEFFIAYYEGKGIYLGARLPSIVNGGYVPREAWQQDFLTVFDLCEQWRTSGGP